MAQTLTVGDQFAGKQFVLQPANGPSLMVQAVAGGGGGGVTSFAGRTGDVTPQFGDYTASDIQVAGAPVTLGADVETALNTLRTYDIYLGYTSAANSTLVRFAALGGCVAPLGADQLARAYVRTQIRILSIHAVAFSAIATNEDIWIQVDGVEVAGTRFTYPSGTSGADLGVDGLTINVLTGSFWSVAFQDVTAIVNANRALRVSITAQRFE